MPLFADLDRLKAELDALRPLLPEQEQRVMQKFRLEWNYNSNAIEGNSLTLGETRSLLLHGLTAEGKPLRDHLDIRGHDEAVRGLEEIVHDERPLTEQFIREMHQVLLGEPHYKSAQTPDGQPTRKRIVPGQYKTAPNNVQTATGEMFYFASPEETPAEMTDLVNWYRREAEQPTLHPVALAAEFHYRFVRVHPFDDGNGRMSRLLMNLILLRAGYAITVIKATDRNRYLAALSEADAGEPEPFLRFIVENVEASLRLMIRAAKGESVDEPSDLDKKLALLKKQVLSRENAIEMVWDSETQVKFYDALIDFWASDFVHQLQKFDDLFISSEVSIVFRTPKTSYEYKVVKNGSEDVLKTIKAAFESDENLPTVVIFLAKWTEFRMLDNPFTQGSYLTISFSKHKFDVTFNIGDWGRMDKSTEEPIFSSIYRNEYPHSTIRDLNHQIANKVYDFIAAKVAEADAPPPQP